MDIDFPLFDNDHVLGDCLVYSTDGGKSCPGCRQPVPGCVCNKSSVTVFPPRPLLWRETRTTPSVAERTLGLLQTQPVTGWRQPGQDFPLSVE